MAKKLLNERTIRRFQKLAMVSPINEMYHKRDEEMDEAMHGKRDDEMEEGMYGKRDEDEMKEGSYMKRDDEMDPHRTKLRSVSKFHENFAENVVKF